VSIHFGPIITRPLQQIEIGYTYKKSSVYLYIETITIVVGARLFSISYRLACYFSLGKDAKYCILSVCVHICMSVFL